MNSLRCREVIARLEPFLDRELSEAELAQVRQHLDDCPPCTRHFHFDEQLRRLIRVRAREEAPPSLRERILRTLHASGPYSDATG